MRVYVDSNPIEEDNPYLFMITENKHGDLSGLEPDYQPFLDAVSSFPNALITPAREPYNINCDTSTQTSFELDKPLSYDVTRGRSLQEWYEKHLTREQLNFVDSGMEKSIRLRGAAGTGKTLALVIKFLRSAIFLKNHNRPRRILILSHSFSTVDMIRNYISSIAENNINDEIQMFHNLRITTLHDIANEKLKYDLIGIDPIALDGYEGRKLQMELLESLVVIFRNSKWIRYRNKCSPAFMGRMSSEPRSLTFRSFVFDIMNEFACVIDAFGAKSLEDIRTKYLRERKLVWMLPVNNDEKLALLEIYESFRDSLKEMKTISTDQMTADFLGYLDSFRWGAVRQNEGYDYVFVDELHLFNRQERLTLHLLSRSTNKTPVVVMAYDPKQSPRDTFMELDSSSADAKVDWKDTNLGEMDAFEFVEIFRYTPQIETFLQALDQSFPVENFGAEWAGSASKSMLKDGPTPTLRNFESTIDLYRDVFERAKRLAKMRKRGRDVAVLCLSYETFATYITAGALRDSFVAISSRDELSLISHAGKRFVFSMPEHVAGLQFETVFLVDVNAQDLAAYGDGIGATRRFVSSLYLGASRAERTLELASVEERGGPPKLLESAINVGALTQLS